MPSKNHVLGWDHHTVDIQRKKLVEIITATIIVVAFRSMCVSPISPEPVAIEYVQVKKFKERAWFFLKISKNYLNNDGQLEFHLDSDPNHEAT